MWSENRRFAVEFLKEAQDRLDKNASSLFTAALEHYTIVAENLKVVSETYPFKECDDERVPVDTLANKTIDSLKRARDAEAAGLDIFSELVNRLT